ncbi:MAG: hypothetical protein V1928_03430 [Parcubacteria group bacterium]
MKPETIVLPEHPAWMLILQTDQLEIWKSKKGRRPSLIHLPPVQPISLQEINERYVPCLVFVADHKLPKHINNPKNCAFIIANFNSAHFTIIGPTPKDIPPLTADEMQYIAKIAEHLLVRLGDLHEEKYYYVLRALQLFVRWERENYLIRCIRSMLSENPELREYAEQIYQLVGALLDRTEVMPTIVGRSQVLGHPDPVDVQLEGLIYSIRLETALAKLAEKDKK